MRISLLVLVFFVLKQDLSGQINAYFGEVVGSYVQFSETDLQRELAVRNSVGLLLGDNWAVGMKFQHIFYNSLAVGSEYMHIWGPFGRWGIRGDGYYIYFESGFNWGNYSSVGNFFTGDVYKEKGLMYISLGLAMEARISKGIYFKIGLTSHELINRPDPQWGFNSYLVGLVFDLQRRL